MRCRAFLLLAFTAPLALSAPARSDDGAALAQEVLVPAGDALLGVQWDDGPERAALVRTARAWIDWGASGADPDARTHVPFDEGAGATATDLAAGAQPVDLRRSTWTRGRFGAGLVLGDAAGLALAPAAAFPAGDFTFELWLRLEAPLRAGTIAEAAGRFALGIDARGLPSLALPLDTGGALVLRGSVPLEAERWTHVAVVVDTGVLRQVRLVVDGAPAWRALDVPLARSPAGALRLGGAGLRAAVDEVRLLARPLSTAALERHARPVPAPGPHRLRLRFAGDRLEERQPFAGVVREPALAGAALGRGALVHATASVDGLRWASGAWQRIDVGSGPTPRTAHPVVYVGAHRALVFGGEVRDSHAPGMVNGDDTWLWDLAARRWERVESPERPSPRCHLPAAWSPDHDLLLLVGGWFNGGPDKRVFSDAWVFRPGTRRWQALASGGARPPRQSDAGLVYHPTLRRFLLFTSRAVFEYDPEADRWARRPPAPAVDAAGAPATALPVISPIMGVDPASGAVVRFGGAYQDGDRRRYTDQTALYDPSANRWTVLGPGSAPGARVRSGFAYDTRRSRFVLFGGVRDQFSERFDDLWSFDPAKRRWARLSASGAPSARGGFYGMAYDPELDVFAVLLGRHAPERFLDEVWHLRIDDAAPGRAEWAFDRSAFPDAERLVAIGLGPGARLAFAGSADGVRWSERVGDPGALGGGARFVRIEAALAPGNDAAQLLELSFGAGRAPCQARTACRSWPLVPLAR